MQPYELIVIGAGHAGIEAALAAARLGVRTLCLCTNLDAVGNMPCNPSIGGTAKGQLVREIDALGGEMARAADFACIQMRMLNRGKGPAVHSPRAQCDRMRYRAYMRRALERQDNVTLIQGEAARIDVTDGAVCGVTLTGGASYAARAVVVAAGTFLGGVTFTGELSRQSGPDGLHAAAALSDGLRALGLTLRRFKTGTPPRIDARTVDFSVMQEQRGEPDMHGFCFDAPAPARNTVVCHLTYTNERTHEVIRGALSRSPLFGGAIQGAGPRYCPSIEDKVVRFADKTRHQLFLEPCGEDTRELYLQGLSTSLPEDVQREMIRTVPGLEHAVIMRPGYAIEYDCLDPLCLTRALAVKDVCGLFAAGQICGSSGYEEAAAQGLVAGVNAAHFLRGRPPLVLSRADGYIGVLIDDLVTKGADEPYRMMTSRSEYRLICRQDNADARLTRIGCDIGLVPPARLARVERNEARVRAEIARLDKTVVPPDGPVNAWLTARGTTPIASGASLAELLRRPEVTYAALADIDNGWPALPPALCEQVEIRVKYEGYIRRQAHFIAEKARMEDSPLPPDMDYLSIGLLRLEARQKLHAIRPATLGQASRIPGVSPADIGALMIVLSSRARAGEA